MSGGDLAIHEPDDRNLAGQLTLPYTDGGRLRFVDLLVPSNGRFGQEDLRQLWEAGAELASWRAARLALAQESGTFGAPEILGATPFLRDWRSLEACANQAASLMAQWPSDLSRRASWFPVGVPGGFEDMPMTEREVTARGYLMERDDRLSVSQSARWLGYRRQLTSASVSAMAAAVIQLVRASVADNDLHFLRPLLSPIAHVAHLSAAPPGKRDPDPSSWPLAFIAFVASCTRVIAELQSAERGKGVVPLLDTDELYEAWLAVMTRDHLDAQLGPQGADPDALACWDRDDITYRLWVKPRIGREGRDFGPARFEAVVAEVLTPDLVLSATRDEETVLHILDAKSWAVMGPEDVLTQSAKYLYGLRLSNERATVPVSSGVDLVTCATQPRITQGHLARVHVTEATPTHRIIDLRTRLDEILTMLSEQIEARERLASAR